MFDEQKAQEAVDFFQSLKLTKGKFHGCYFDLQGWQDKIVRDLYGTLKPDMTRQYKTAYIEIPKKMGKSEMAAGFALKQLCADNEWMAEVYGCAADKANASQVFDVAVEMIDQEPELKSRCDIVISKKRIIYLPTKSFYQVLSAEAYTKHGLNVSGCVFDELHAQPNRGLFDVMTFGSGDAREQPLYILITTAGDDPDRLTVGWEMHYKAEQTLLGNRVDPTFYPVIFGIDEENKRIWQGWTYTTFDSAGVIIEKNKETEYWKDPRNRKIWFMVNPSVGQTVKPEKFEEAFTGVQGNPSEERNFKWLRLNIWNKYKQTKWVGLDIWDLNTGIVDSRYLEKKDCYGGMDLSTKIDISASVLVFPPQEGLEKWTILPRFYIPEDNMKKRIEEDGVPYDHWVEMGLLIKTPGNKIDYRFIEKDVLEMRDRYNIREIGYDPWNAYDVEPTLTDSGITMAEIRQGFKSMSPPMKELEALLLGKHVNHGNNPILRWMFGNLEVKADENDNIRPVKGTDKKKRIDGIVAIINAMARAILHEDTSSAYEDHGIVVI
jgi:phage terminase large subunit-like protein